MVTMMIGDGGPPHERAQHEALAEAPTGAVPAAATARAATNGSPAVMVVQARNAPIIISSPVAKLMTPVAL